LVVLVRTERWRVLVVEDDDLFVERLRVLLASDRRFEVVGRARNGREAVGLTLALAPDLVLMDIEMPVMDGVEATWRIRASTPRVGIIAVSGTDYQERALEVREAGATDYVRKSRLDEDLLNSCAAALEGDDPGNESGWSGSNRSAAGGG
jgi:DNA-binding NarL/FixJ family response regulator